MIVFKKFTFCTFLIISIFLLIACKQEPIMTFGYSIPQTFISSDQSHKKMHDIIEGALQTCGWKYSEPNNDMFIASYVYKDKHIAFITIIYSSTHYEIKYKDSLELKHKINEKGIEVIHKAYNQWVSKLNTMIRAGII